MKHLARTVKCDLEVNLSGKPLLTGNYTENVQLRIRNNEKKGSEMIF